MIRRPPRSTPLYSSAASDVYKRQVYDVADLYKTSLAVPVAFECAATGAIDDLAGITRRAMRDAFHESKLLTKCVQDIHVLLDAPGDPDEGYGWDIVDLWDDREGVVAGGRSWS